MGNELRKLMQQFGVSTPSMANYSGTQMPTKPPEAPTAPILAENATKDQRKQYDADLKAYTTAQDTYAKDKAAFDEQVRKYGLDKAQYDKYAADYQNRIGNTNMYNQAQFSTTGANVPAFTTYSDAQKAAMGMMPAQQAPVASPQVMPPVDAQPAPGPQDFAGTGQGGLNNYIQQYMGTNPSMSDMNDMQKRYGFNEYDVRNAMGTGTQYGAPQWQDSIKAPGYGITPITFGQMPDADRADWYNTQRNLGYTDADLRAGAEKTFGQMDNQNWYQMTGNAAPAPAPKPSSGFFSGLLGRGALSALSQNYAQGGSVKGYRPGGPVDMLYGGAGNTMMMGGAEEDTLTTPAPVDPMADMRARLDLYAPSTVTSEQIAAAAERRVAEQKAFEDILRSQLQGTDGEPMSKAEKYFRLAAAFGAPTKTGHFAENLGLVGEEMSSQLAAKAQREREARERGLGVELEIQKMRMGTAGEEYDALRGVQSEEAKYRRDVANELLKEQMEVGKNKFRRATAEEAAAYNATAGQFGPDGRFYAIDVPQGMTIESDGAGGVRFVQGPVGSGKPPTEGQLAGAGYLQRMTAAEEILRDLERREGVVSIPVEKTILMDTGIEGYVLNAAEQQVAQAQRDWVRSKLRKESGAVIGAEEMAAEIKTYFPQPGEGSEVIAQKAEARRRAERQMQIGSGTAAEQAGDISQPYAAPIRADELARAGIGGGPASQPVVIDGVTIRKVN